MHGHFKMTIQRFEPQLFDSHVFDFDGVLADTAKIKSDCFLGAADEMLCEFKDQFSKALLTELVGAGRKKVAGRFEELARSLFSSEGFLRSFEWRLGESSFSISMVPGAKDFVEKLSKTSKLFIVSAAPEAEIKKGLGAMGIDPKLFLAVHGIESGKKAQVLWRLISEGQISSSSAVFYGDMPTDCEAALENSVKFVRLLTEPGCGMAGFLEENVFLSIKDFCSLQLC